MILGKSVCDKLIFMNDLNNRLNYLEQEIGYEAAELYIQVFCEMQIQFEPYMNKKYPGLLGIKNKCDEYAKIDYSKVFELINQYKSKKFVDELENKQI